MKRFLLFVGVLTAIIAAGYLVGQYAFAAAFPYATGGTGSSTVPAVGQVFYAGPTAWQSRATTTATCSSGASCPSFDILGNSPVSITATGIFPFTPTTNFGALTNATNTPIWFQAGIQSSSTNQLSTTTVNTQDDDGFIVSGTATNHLGLFKNTGTGAAHISFCNATTGCTVTHGIDIGLQSPVNGSDGFIRNREVAGLDFLVNTSYNALNILSSGNVGIGTTTPYGKLAVSLQSTDAAYPNNNAFIIASSTASATTTLFTISNTGSTTISRFGACNTTSALTTDASGNITCGTITASGSAYPFTPSTDGGINTSATSTPIQGTNPGLGLDVSNTSWYGIGGSLLAYASSTNDVTVFGLGAGGQVATTSNSVRNTTAIGFKALNAMSGGSNNTALGSLALTLDSTGSSNTALGAGTVDLLTTGKGNTGAGFGSLQSVTTNDYNTAFGYQAGTSVTGYANIFVGAQVTSPTTISGNGNVGLGNEIFLPSNSSSNQLNIGNIIFGSLPATTTLFTLPLSGSIGIGTSSPFSKFAIHTNNGDTATTLFAIGSSTATATTTLFSVSNVGQTSIAESPIGVASTSIATPSGNIFAVHSASLTLASSTLTYYGAFGAAGTTTTAITNPLHASILQSFFCRTDIGTAWVGFGTGSATTTEIQCTTSGAATTLSTNNIWNGRQTVYVDVGHSASAPNLITITADVEDKN